MGRRLLAIIILNGKLAHDIFFPFKFRMVFYVFLVSDSTAFVIPTKDSMSRFCTGSIPSCLLLELVLVAVYFLV